VERPLERRGRLVEVAALFLNEPERQVRQREVRVQLDRVVALLEGRWDSRKAMPHRAR
jgi:hypothetical protein